LIDLNCARDATREEGLELLTRLRGIDDTLSADVMTGWLAFVSARRAARADPSISLGAE